MPRTRLAGEFGKVRTGAQADLRFCRLPVQPQGRSGPTDTRPLTEPLGQNTSNVITTGLSGPSVHVSDRFVNSHRKTSSPRPTAYETHTVASQKQLEGTGIIGKSDPYSQVSAPPCTKVARRRQRSHRPIITPNKTCYADLYRHIKRRVGRSLRRAHSKRNLVSSRKQAAYKLPRTQSSFSSFKRVPRPVLRHDSTYSNRQHHGGVIHKQERRHEVRPTLCATMGIIPGWLNVVADKLSRLGQTIQTEWSLLPEVFQTKCSRWHRPQIDLFATRFNNKLPLFVSPVPDTLATAVDAVSLPWEDLDIYAFPPAAILGKVV